MNASTPVFLMGIAIGTGLLIVGLLLGAWIGRRSAPVAPNPMGMDPNQFLLFLQNLSRWTNEVSGDVSKYQSQLNHLNQHVQSTGTQSSREEVQALLSKIMDANSQLQARLDSAEVRLESQTKEIANYLTEARTDGLTGLANRRAFDQELDSQFKRFAQHQKKFTLAIIDIDHFKKVNDTYGHPAGDAVLREVATRLKQNLPQAFQVARYGGEEFAILLPPNLQQAAEIMDQVRLTVAQTPIKAEGHSLPITLSCGVAEIVTEERIGKLVRRADEALYAAKMGGRNRVYLHDGKLAHPVGSPGPSPTHHHPSPSTVPSTEGPSSLDDPLRDRLQKRLARIVEEEVKGSTSRHP